MSTVFQIAVSGLSAQSNRLAVSADNIANFRSLGVRPGPGADNRNAFVPQAVEQTSIAQGGVRTRTVPVSPPSVPVFDPNHPAADDQGLLYLPNVSVEAELVEQIQASAAYRANLRVIEAQDALLGIVINIAS